MIIICVGNLSVKERHMNLRDRLFVSTVAEDAADTAREFGLKLEIAEFCTAMNMDGDFATWDAIVRDKLRGDTAGAFHAPFNELCPSAIDPKILAVAKSRYADAYELMRTYGTTRMIAHSGYVPLIYFKEYFVERSIEFWREFLADKPEDFTLLLENVLEDSPDILIDVVRGVDDARFRLCLDVGHANTIVSELPVKTWIERGAGLISHVHLHNNYRAWDHHNPLHDGIIDMRECMALLCESAPETTFTLESLIARPSAVWLAEEGYL
jgi:sugar phosphate isomerase/epimerase